MDQAALQRVTLVWTSGTLCWTVWSAREQQSLHTWIVSFFRGSALNQLAHSAGEWFLFWISGWSLVLAMLQCTAGTLLRRRRSWSTWTVLQIFFIRRCWDKAYFDDESIAAASMSCSTTTRCWPCLRVPEMVFFLTWLIVMSTLWCISSKWLVTDGHSPCPVWPRCQRHWAAPRHGERHKPPGHQCPFHLAWAYAFW